jgi:hypothetical protein
LEELDKQLATRGEGEKKYEGPPLKSMKTSNLQHILSAMETLTDALCETDKGA